MGSSAWEPRDSIRLGGTGEILVNLESAPGDTDEVTRVLETMFTFETVEFVTDTDDGGRTTEWAVLRNAMARTGEGVARAS